MPPIGPIGPFTPGPFYPPGPIFPPGPIYPPPYGRPTEVPAGSPAAFVALNDLLEREDVEGLLRYALSRERDFGEVRTIAPAAEGESIDFEQRRVRQITDLGPHTRVVHDRVRAVVPGVLNALNIKPATGSAIEARVLSLNDGESVTLGAGPAAESIRQVTFVYFFHREPRRFEGGTLRLRDAAAPSSAERAAEKERLITGEMRNNSIVFLSPGVEAAIGRVDVRSRKFADSAFAIVGILQL